MKLSPIFWNQFPPGFSGKGIIIPPTPSLSLLRAAKASPLGYPVVLLVLLESLLHKDPKQSLQNITQICNFYLKPLRELIHYICSMCFPQFRRPYIIQLSPLLWPGFVRFHHLLKCVLFALRHILFHKHTMLLLAPGVFACYPSIWNAPFPTVHMTACGSFSSLRSYSNVSYSKMPIYPQPSPK